MLVCDNRNRGGKLNSLIYRAKSKKGIYEIKDLLEESLKKRRFGILSEIDVAKVMKKKGVDFDDELLLLGVCDPHFAKKALSVNDDVAVSLPCSIVVQKNGGGSVIKLAKPSFVVNYFKNDSLNDLGQEVEAILVEAIDEAAGHE